MIENKINNSLNVDCKFISITSNNFIIDIKIKYKKFYKDLLKIYNTGLFEIIFSNIQSLVKNDKIKSKLYLSILLTDDAEITKINKKSRKMPYPTNVLSFSSLDFMKDNKLDSSQNNYNDELFLGDIVISIERIFSEASSEKKKVIDHFLHIFIHGVLHLLGYDHKTDRDADKMELIEAQILNYLGIKNPYI